MLILLSFKIINLTTNQILGYSDTGTIDQEELSKFHLKSEEWWTGEQFFPLRLMNQLRVPLISNGLNPDANKSISKPLNGYKLLDVGCGGGILSESLARLGGNVVGIDPVNDNVLVARNHSKLDENLNENLNYENITIEEFSSKSNNSESFDAVIASEVLEHVNDVDLFIKCSLKCLKKGGKLFITTINQNPISFVGAIIFGEYVFGLLPKGTHDYHKFISPKALQLLLQESKHYILIISTNKLLISDGCDVKLIHGMYFNPLTYNWSWTQNTSINYAVESVKNPN